MEKKIGEWTLKGTEQKFCNEFFVVNEDDVIQPDGKPGKYAIVKMKPGVCVLPVDDENFVYLNRQFRYAVECDCLEVACGGIEEGEPLDAAKRELREELGITADEWIDLGSFDIDTSIVVSPAYLFIAKKLKFTQPNREGTEKMQTIKIPFAEAIEKVMNGEITHGASCVLLLKAWIKSQNGQASLK